MELWIRSQDKTRLSKITQVKFVGKENDLDDCENVIRGYGIDGYNFRLGIYKSKERASEVLDEIQNILQPPVNFIISQHIDFADGQEGLIGVNVLKEEPKIERISDIIVYEMPKE